MFEFTITAAVATVVLKVNGEWLAYIRTFLERRWRSGTLMVCMREPLEAILISIVLAVNARM